ncbi:RagB/SusD family nutrient uptake outer membrane protein [Hymenobacter cellulosivorans]|uniref:RagB/SusD family nutrient uptake outer membrane protein n=1 Tax=Hymenobacter cellulosivorans TaxID=2932249 RepID=A0ABY4F3Z1_9BACT|nr:RagB/SusD family nutrient uptake outer membrane protein [Hymenobacter cellulosivorans]UOQ51199.1 RagB/SusD family nutrient uptake outer membrane protein [Hymenobacter cellulosivorans]
MKTFKHLTCAALLGLGTLLLASCEDKLDISPEARNSTADFYKDESDVNQGVISIYNSCMSFPTNSYWNMAEMRGDNIVVSTNLNAQRDYADINFFLASSQTGQFQATWADLFEAVYRANLLQEKIQPFTFARVNQFKGEARFLRALAYFDLVRFWGPVPIVDKVVTATEAKQIPRASIADVYSFIVEDLKFAAENLPDTYTTEKGRATKWAAKALLGRVYLTMYGYPLKQASALPLAKQQLADVIAQEGKAGVPTMSSSFKALFQTANDNKFHLFEIQYISGTGGLGSQIPSDQAFQFPSQWSAFQPFGLDAGVNPNLLGAGWPKKDLRKEATLDSGYVDTKTNAKSGRVQFTKFLEKGTTAPTGQRDYPNNYPVIRFEDVLLMQAEVLNEEVADGGNVSAQALTYVNRIRTRSGVPALTSMSKVNFRLALERERRWEFAAEGLRWHDLVRTGRALAVMNQFITDNKLPRAQALTETDLLFPIPLAELRINPGFWQQNPGYN